MSVRSEQPEADTSKTVWYLGIDFGTTGVSAVLFNYSTARQYPIYWSNPLQVTQEKSSSVKSQFPTRSSGGAIFRLPAATYFNPTTHEFVVHLPMAPLVAGSLTSKPTDRPSGLLLQNFKPYLNLGIPYYYPQRLEWEPTLQLSGQELVSLYSVRKALQALLEMLKPKSGLPNSEMAIGSIGLESETLVKALQQLEGVILGYPASWGDTYHFNLREAVLEAKLVRHPEEIFFLEDAIAPILAWLGSSNADAPLQGGDGEKVSPPLAHPPTPSPSRRGSILVLNAGATTTELALVDLPDDLEYLTYSDFSLSSLAYAGNAIDQDIVCQLLYPQFSLSQRQQLAVRGDLELPLPGQPDREKRDRLALQLQSSPFGQAILKAAGYLKLILQHKEEFTLELGSDRWVVRRQDLDASIVLPFVQQLNRELKALLIQAGIWERGIHQVFCIGGTAVFGKLQQWLQQKLPNATLIRDADSPTGNWVAAGLASVPLHPQVINRYQQQYSEYFLLLELLRAFAETTDTSVELPSYSLEEIVQRLERRGLNTGTCYERLVRLIEGQLPPGLVPSIDNAIWLSQASKQNFASSTIAASEGLFSQEGDRLYRPNPQAQQHLRKYMDIILSRTHQKFEEPLIINLDTKDG